MPGTIIRIPRGEFLIVEIRKARREDVPAIFDLIKGKAEFDGCLDSLRSTSNDIEQAFFSAQPTAFAFLATISGEVAGIATYYSIYSTFNAKPGIWLDDLYVYPQFRGIGVGKALLAELCFLAQKTGCGRIDWIVARDNVQGRSFYEQSGARIFEEVRHARLDERAIGALVEKSRYQTILAPVKGEEFEFLFSVVKHGLYSHVDAVFGWCDDLQRERLHTEYEAHWFNWVYIDSKRIGMLCFKPCDHALHVHLLIIFPEFQNQKLGEIVMQYVHQLARAQGKIHVTLSSFARNKLAIKFYQSLGYQVVDGDENFLSLSFRVS